MYSQKLLQVDWLASVLIFQLFLLFLVRIFIFYLQKFINIYECSNNLSIIQQTQLFVQASGFFFFEVFTFSLKFKEKQGKKDIFNLHSNELFSSAVNSTSAFAEKFSLF